MSATASAIPQESVAGEISTPVEKRVRKKRTYMLHDPEKYTCLGKYVSTSPRLAALKAASRNHRDILLRETNTKIMHRFEGGIRALDTPQVVSRGDQTVTYTSKPFVKSKGHFLMNNLVVDDSCVDSIPTNPTTGV